MRQGPPADWDPDRRMSDAGMTPLGRRGVGDFQDTAHVRYATPPLGGLFLPPVRAGSGVAFPFSFLLSRLAITFRL